MEIAPIGTIFEFDLNSFSANGLLLLHNCARHALVVDDNTKNGRSPMAFVRLPFGGSGQMRSNWCSQ